MKRIELDCPHPDCRAIIPIRIHPDDEYSGTYWCRCEGCRVRISVQGGEAKVELVK